MTTAHLQLDPIMTTAQHLELARLARQHASGSVGSIHRRLECDAELLDYLSAFVSYRVQKHPNGPVVIYDHLGERMGSGDTLREAIKSARDWMRPAGTPPATPLSLADFESDAAAAALWTAAADHHERTAEIRRQCLVDDSPAPAGGIEGLTDGPVHVLR